MAIVALQSELPLGARRRTRCVGRYNGVARSSSRRPIRIGENVDVGCFKPTGRCAPDAPTGENLLGF